MKSRGHRGTCPYSLLAVWSSRIVVEEGETDALISGGTDALFQERSQAGIHSIEAGIEKS